MAAGQWNSEKVYDMAVSKLRLIKHCVEFKDKPYIEEIPLRTRGVYVLYKKKTKKNEGADSNKTQLPTGQMQKDNSITNHQPSRRG